MQILPKQEAISNSQFNSCIKSFFLSHVSSVCFVHVVRLLIWHIIDLDCTLRCYIL